MNDDHVVVVVLQQGLSNCLQFEMNLTLTLHERDCGTCNGIGLVAVSGEAVNEELGRAIRFETCFPDAFSVVSVYQ